MDVTALADWVRANNVPEWAQVMKVSEEAGEAMQAYLGYIGANPRKGVCNTQSDVVDELADTAITALVAIHILGRDSVHALAKRIDYLERRLAL